MSIDSIVLLDAAGRRRSPATLPGYLTGRAPRNKGMQYPPGPPRPEEIILVMRQAGHDRHGVRIRALIAVLWRGGLRISEALALNETDVDGRRGSLPIRHGKGDKRREAGMDQFGFEQLEAWRGHRELLPPGPLFCVIDGHTCGRRWAATAARAEHGSSPLRLACDVGSRPTSCDTRTRSNSRAKAWRSTSSSTSSGTPISVPPRRICRVSIPARSSTPSAPGDHPPSQPAPDSRSDSTQQATPRICPPARREAAKWRGFSSARTGPEAEAVQPWPVGRRSGCQQWSVRRSAICALSTTLERSAVGRRRAVKAGLGPVMCC
jgi:hypothetical protein